MYWVSPQALHTIVEVSEGSVEFHGSENFSGVDCGIPWKWEFPSMQTSGDVAANESRLQSWRRCYGDISQAQIMQVLFDDETPELVFIAQRPQSAYATIVGLARVGTVLVVLLLVVWRMCHGDDDSKHSPTSQMHCACPTRRQRKSWLPVVLRR